MNDGCVELGQRLDNKSLQLGRGRSLAGAGLLFVCAHTQGSTTPSPIIFTFLSSFFTLFLCHPLSHTQHTSHSQHDLTTLCPPRRPAPSDLLIFLLIAH